MTLSLEELYLKHSQKELAKILGLSRGGVQNLLKRNGLSEEWKWKEIFDRQECWLGEDADSYYFLGYVLGDGSISNSSRHSYDITVVSNDEYPISVFAERFKTELGRDRECHRMFVNNKKAYEWLYSKGIRPSKSVEGCHVQVPEEYYWDFMRGLLDSDGNVFNGDVKQVTWYGHESYMLDIITDINYYFEYPTYRPVANMKCIRICRGRDIKVARDLMYYKGCLCLERKKDKIDGIIRELC